MYDIRRQVRNFARAAGLTALLVAGTIPKYALSQEPSNLAETLQSYHEIIKNPDNTKVASQLQDYAERLLEAKLHQTLTFDNYHDPPSLIAGFDVNGNGSYEIVIAFVPDKAYDQIRDLLDSPPPIKAMYKINPFLKYEFECPCQIRDALFDGEDNDEINTFGLDKHLTLDRENNPILKHKFMGLGHEYGV